MSRHGQTYPQSAKFLHSFFQGASVPYRTKQINSLSTQVNEEVPQENLVVIGSAEIKVVQNFAPNSQEQRHMRVHLCATAINADHESRRTTTEL